MKDIRRGMWFMAIGIMLFVAAQSFAEQPNPGRPETDEKGCLCFYNGGNGKFYYNAFIKTADKDSPGESGEAEIWGYNVEPGNDIRAMHKITEDNQVVPVNARRDIWIPADGRMHEVPAGTTRRKTKCPPYWNPQPTSSAYASH